MKIRYHHIIRLLIAICTMVCGLTPLYSMDVLYQEKGVTITQNDIATFGNGTLDEDRFDALQAALTPKIPEFADKTFVDYQQLDPAMRGAAKEVILTALQNLQKQENPQELPSSAQSAPTIHAAIQNAGTWLFNDAPDIFLHGISTIVGGPIITPKKPSIPCVSIAEDSDDKYQDALGSDDEFEDALPIDMTKINTTMQKAEDSIKNIDKKTARLTKKLNTAIKNTQDKIDKMEADKINAIKKQNEILIGGLLPAQINIPDPINRTIQTVQIDPGLPFPVAVYRSDLIHGAHCATKLCVAYWVLSYLSACRARHIYHAMVGNLDEFITLLETNIEQQKNPPIAEKRTWKQTATDFITRKPLKKSAAQELNEHIVKHHTYIGYNPCKRALMVPLIAYLLTNAGIAYSEQKNLNHDTDYAESSQAYVKDTNGTLQPLDADFTPMAATTMLQCLSIRGFFSTLIDKAPQSIKELSPVPLSQKELLEKIGTHAPARLRTSIESQAMQNVGLLAASLLEIKIMDSIYQARWQIYITSHMPYLLELLKRYRDVRMLPADDATRIQYEEEIMQCVKEGNTLSGLNRATLWTTIARAANSTVSWLIISPIIACAVWHYKKQIGHYTLVAGQAAIQTTIAATVIAFKFGVLATVAAARGIARNEGIQRFAHTIGEKINRGLYSIRNMF